MKMRILWLGANLLLPLDKGGKLRTWHLLRHVAKRHEITYVSFAAPATPETELQGMREVASRVETVERSEAGKDGFRFYADVARHLASPLPYAVAKYRSRRYSALVARLLDEVPFDLVVSDFLVPAVNLPRELPCPSVVFTHNVEAEIWRRHREAESNRLRKKLLEQQWGRMLRFEGDTLARFDLVLTVSEVDKDTIDRLYPNVRSRKQVVPTGVDIEYFAPSLDRPEPGRLVFTGSMDWLPNEDAMLHFASEVLPKIRQLAPGTTLSIVGRSPTAAIRRLGSEPGIEVTGSVPDVRPWIAKASVYIVPLRIGGGTRLKIFEAMAMGKPVVSTTVGAEGLPVEDGVNIVLADGAGDFARAVARLLGDPALGERLGQSARDLMVKRCDWSVVAADLEEALVSVAAGGRLSPETAAFHRLERRNSAAAERPG